MTPLLYWIEGPWVGHLAITARPRGGDWLEEEVKGWRASGINVAASLLTEEEIESFELKEEERIAREKGIVFHSFPILDRSVPPSYDTALNFIRGLEKELAEGKNLAIHCRQGLGRAATIAASLLVLGGLEPETSIERVSRARGTSVPETKEQSNWVTRLAREAAQVRS